jgi:hypothetical protein
MPPRGFLRLPALFAGGLFVTALPLVVVANLIWSVQ